MHDKAAPQIKAAFLMISSPSNVSLKKETTDQARPNGEKRAHAIVRPQFKEMRLSLGHNRLIDIHATRRAEQRKISDDSASAAPKSYFRQSRVDIEAIVTRRWRIVVVEDNAGNIARAIAGSRCNHVKIIDVEPLIPSRVFVVRNIKRLSDRYDPRTCNETRVELNPIGVTSPGGRLLGSSGAARAGVHDLDGEPAGESWRTSFLNGDGPFPNPRTGRRRPRLGARSLRSQNSR